MLEKIYNWHLDARNLNNLVQTNLFMEAYNFHGKEKVDPMLIAATSLEPAIRKEAFQNLRGLIKNYQLSEMTIRALRTQASQAGIRYYAKMGRGELIQALKEVEIHAKSGLRGESVTSINSTDGNPSKGGDS